MSDPKDYASLISQYHRFKRAGGGSQDQSPQAQRQIAVTAALTLLDSQASGGKTPVHEYKDEIGPLADAIQEALKHEE